MLTEKVAVKAEIVIVKFYKRVYIPVTAVTLSLTGITDWIYC